MSDRLPLLVDRAGEPLAWLLLAHGAGAPMDSDYMNALTEALNQQRISVARFEFPYMERRRREGRKFPPDRMPKLSAAFLCAFREFQGQPAENIPVLIGGKSMGGRVASMLADQWSDDSITVDGVCCFGYPFHAPGKKDNLRIEHLLGQSTPTLILQGTRDPFGKPDELEGIGLSEKVAICWLEGGDHDFKPLVKSGLVQQQLLKQAAEQVAAFVGTL